MRTFVATFGIITALAVGSAASVARAQTDAGVTFFTVKVDVPQNGEIKIHPPIPEDHQVRAGTVLKIKATPARGYALDSGYYWSAAKSGMYFETPTPEFEVTIDQNKTVGASFIEQQALKGFKVINNVVFARPGVKALKYDVYSPHGAKHLPCIVIIHGGGWSVNCEDVMRGLARELVRGGKYVVASVDYRWLGTQDGDTQPNSMADIIDDVYGAIAHLQEHAQEYGADPTRLAVTGDSAGGQLSAAAINLADHIGDGGFGVKEGVYEFKPSYLPAGKTAAQVRTEILQAIKAAAPSYGIFSSAALGGWAHRGGAGDVSEAAIKAISPQDNIPNIKDRAVPQFLLRGTRDTLIQNSTVQAYADALMAAGQSVTGGINASGGTGNTYVGSTGGGGGGGGRVFIYTATGVLAGGTMGNVTVAGGSGATYGGSGTATLAGPGISITINSSPAGAAFTVDGTNYNSAQVLSVIAGSTHALSTTTPQAAGAGLQRLFSNWSDGGALAHSVTPTNNITYTANFLLAAKQSSRITNSARMSNGYFQLTFTNVSGAGFTVLAATNLNTPLTNWTAIGTATENPAGAGRYQFTDTLAPTFLRRFYDVKSP